MKHCQITHFFHSWQTCLGYQQSSRGGLSRALFPALETALLWPWVNHFTSLCLFPPISLCFDIWRWDYVLAPPPWCDPLPAASAVTSWHSSNGRCRVAPSLPWGWAVFMSCIHRCASIPGAKCCALSTAIASRPGCPKQKCTGSVANKSSWEHTFTSLKVPHLFLNGKNNNAKL